MANKFQQAKELYDLQKKAKAMQKELRDTEIEAVSPDEKISVVINGELKLVELNIDENYMREHSTKELETALKTTFTEGLNKAQAVAAERTREIMKDMNLNIPGM